MVRIKFKQLKLLNSLDLGNDDDIIFSSLQRQGSLIDCVFVRPIETVQRMGFESRQCRVATGISIEGVGAKSKKSYNCGQLDFNKAWNNDTRYSRRSEERYYLMVHVKII